MARDKLFLLTGIVHPPAKWCTTCESHIEALPSDSVADFVDDFHNLNAVSDQGSWSAILSSCQHMPRPSIIS